MTKEFEKVSFAKRMKSMLRVDLRRNFTMPFYYIMVGISFVIPILILVMTTMMDGTVSVNPQTGKETVMEGFDNVWQIFGAISSAGGMGAAGDAGAASAGMNMDLVSMCNINMMYFGIAVFVCVFVADDFRSGYAKNLFTVRAKKTDYVISKTVVGFIGGASMILAFSLGALLGGGIANLPFEMVGFDLENILACILSKTLVVLVFVPIYLIMSVVAKQKLWLSILLSLCTGMFLFAIVPMITPLDANIVHIVLCVAGGVLFAIGLGAISNLVLKKTRLV